MFTAWLFALHFFLLKKENVHALYRNIHEEEIYVYVNALEIASTFINELTEELWLMLRNASVLSVLVTFLIATVDRPNETA